MKDDTEHGPMLKHLLSQVKRATTVHDREQRKGLTDMSCQQTRRMYLAAVALQRASGRLWREERSAALWEVLSRNVS